MIVRAYTRHLDETAHNEGKRNTQQIERTHVTLRTRIKRLARKTMCFARSTQMHDIILGLFVNRSCTCPLRINIAGSPVDRQRIKKAYTRGLSWHPSGPFTPGDALKAGRADTPTPRQLTATRRSLSCALFLTPPRVVAT